MNCVCVWVAGWESLVKKKKYQKQTEQYSLRLKNKTALEIALVAHLWILFCGLKQRLTTFVIISIVVIVICNCWICLLAN